MAKDHCVELESAVKQMTNGKHSLYGQLPFILASIRAPTRSQTLRMLKFPLLLCQACITPTYNESKISLISSALNFLNLGPSTLVPVKPNNCSCGSLITAISKLSPINSPSTLSFNAKSDT